MWQIARMAFPGEIVLKKSVGTQERALKDKIYFVPHFEQNGKNQSSCVETSYKVIFLCRASKMSFDKKIIKK